MSSDATNETSPVRPGRRRLVILLIVGGLIVGGVAFYRHFWLHRSLGSGPAGPRVDRSAFEDPWTTRKVHLVGLGDSITEGYGATPSNLSYFARLAENPPNEFPEMKGICLSKVLPELEVSNLGISGTTSIEILEKLIPRLDVQDDDVFGIVTLTTGGNDIIHNYGRTPPREGAMYGATLKQAEPWIENYRKRLDETISEIETRFPGGCRIFIANVYDPTDGVGDAFNAGLPRWPEGLSLIEAYNIVIADCAKKHDSVHLIDIHDEFLGHGIHSLQFWHEHYDSADPHYWYWENLEDPNNRGYDVIRRLFLIEMARVLPPLLGYGPDDRKPN